MDFVVDSNLNCFLLRSLSFPKSTGQGATFDQSLRRQVSEGGLSMMFQWRLRCLFLLCGLTLPDLSRAHELGARLGAYQAQEGESRRMLRATGRADFPAFVAGDVTAYLSLNAAGERVHVDGEAFEENEYMRSNFSGRERIDRSVGVDHGWVMSKRTDVTIGYSVATDTVTTSKTMRAAAGQWFMGDQLRLGLSYAATGTRRPQARILDTDYTGINIRPQVTSRASGLNVKGILNPTTIVTGDYTHVQSSDRPVLHAWNLSVRKYEPVCDCAVHLEGGRVINIGALNTNMSDGELTGSQWGAAFLPTLWRGGHARLAYRYAREDEFTRAYGDHLVFGSDQYALGISQEFQGDGRTTLIDFGATRYIRNRYGTASALEAGASIKF